MVRRLKEDLRQLNQGDFPKRRVGAVLLEQAGAGGLSATIRFDDGKKDPLGTVTAGVVDGEPVELRLAKLLAEYTGLMRPERGPGRLLFINLQKRLLSSLEALGDVNYKLPPTTTTSPLELPTSSASELSSG
jgi:hypothetical protein